MEEKRKKLKQNAMITSVVNHSAEVASKAAKDQESNPTNGIERMPFSKESNSAVMEAMRQTAIEQYCQQMEENPESCESELQATVVEQNTQINWEGAMRTTNDGFTQETGSGTG